MLAWIFAENGKISVDIGYSVNNAENGVWLPSNNAMRGQWTDKTSEFKVDYAKEVDGGGAR